MKIVHFIAEATSFSQHPLQPSIFRNLEKFCHAERGLGEVTSRVGCLRRLLRRRCGVSFFSNLQDVRG